MSDGLPPKAADRIRAVLASFPEIEQAVLYGSRAKGNYRPGSDIDLALYGQDLEHPLLARINDALDDLMLPYRIDLSIYARLTHPDLIDHIRRVGVPFYEKSRAGVSA